MNPLVEVPLLKSAELVDGNARLERIDAAVYRIPVDPEFYGHGGEEVDVLIVDVLDADGVEGRGFTSTMGLGIGAVRAMVEDVFTPELVGSTLTQWETNFDRLARSTRWLGRGVASPALSALDIAIWDLRAKKADRPLYALLGGEARAMPIYGSGLGATTRSVSELVAGTERYLAQGCTSIKIRVGAHRPEEDLSRIDALRSAVGDDVRLMVDCNERLDRSEALWLVPRLADRDVGWIEEPLRFEDISGYELLARETGVVVATGEHLMGRAAFAEYIARSAVAIVQPDAVVTGGIGESLAIAALAKAHGLPVCYHAVPEVHVHLALVTENCPTVEHFPILDRALAQPLSIIDGTVTAPDVPGHGMIWDEDVLARCQIGA